MGTAHKIWRSRKRRGISYVEIIIATMIVGLCFTAILSSIQSSTKTNEASTDHTQAVFLAQQIREMIMNMPFRDPQTPGNTPGPDSSSPATFADDMDDIMGMTYSPPLNSTPRAPSSGNVLGTAITDPALANWSQTITMSWRSPTDLTTEVQAGTSDIVYVQVEVKNSTESILTMGWLVTNN